ncbi:hypothetical protein [Chryseolinea lacunae]|uniref:DUF1735 domain-containing protein n=1 Tax=Chryseolinea lacunae TaxID=2801331 RepID=A0ABS1KYL8_9BACT|nr:hypothetical protein [Chryseolinea lacunae]MBL0744425.1 hypothetical protein [Chryseolinea lacunae]
MKMRISIQYSFVIAALLLCSSCLKDPYNDVVSNERSIEAVTLGGGLTQVGPAIVDREAGKVSVQVLMEANTKLDNVSPILQASYHATTFPASGEPVNFEASNNQYTYTVTAQSGQTREWVIELVPFTETLPGTYKITGQVLYGGTGPEYGGGGVMKLTDKSWVWPATGGPAAEDDNILTFEFKGVTPEGHTFGAVSNTAGTDGLYADYQFIDKVPTDVNKFYRKIPKGEGTWERDYSKQTITFKFADGTTTTGSVSDAKTIDLGNGLSKTIADKAFDFILNGTDDWGNIYSDYDKIVKKPRRFWIDVKKQ